MSKTMEIVRKLWEGFVKSIREFPLEALLGVTYFLIFIFESRVSGVFGKSDIYYLFFWFFPHYVLLFTLHKLSRKHLIFRVLYCLSWFLWIPLLIWGSGNQGWSLGVAYLIALILLVIGEELLDNESYGKNILNVALNVAAGFLTGFLLMGTLTAIIASINFLFGLDLKDNWFTFPNAFIAFIIIPLLCCSLVTRNRIKGNWQKIMSVTVDHILSPALVIFAAILYVYLARIIIRWELPNGGVAYIVASFISVGLVCHLFRLLVDKRHFEWFYKAFPIIAIAPLVLLWIGIFRRVGDYGITQTRFYLILFATLLTFFTAMLTKERTRKFQLMTLILACAAFLFTFIPGIRAKDFERRSQAGRIQENKPAAELDLNEREEGRVWSLEPVDIGEYTQLVPSSGYHYYEDADVVVFYRDSTRMEELLRCEIRKALDSPGDDPLGKLVYKNDDYLAIFDEIHDYHNSSISFSTGHRTLFKKRSQ